MHSKLKRILSMPVVVVWCRIVPYVVEHNFSTIHGCASLCVWLAYKHGSDVELNKLKRADAMRNSHSCFTLYFKLYIFSHSRTIAFSPYVLSPTFVSSLLVLSFSPISFELLPLVVHSLNLVLPWLHFHGSTCGELHFLRFRSLFLFTSNTRCSCTETWRATFITCMVKFVSLFLWLPCRLCSYKNAN